MAHSASSPSPQQWAVLYYDDGVPVYACAYHPDRETTLRCGRCGKPICTQCAILTDVGYRCPDCVTELRGRFYHATHRHILTALIAALGLGFLAGLAGGFFTSLLGIWGVFLAMPLAGLVAEGIWKAGARHRAPRLNLYVTLLVLISGGLGLLVESLFLPSNLLAGSITLVIIASIVYRRTGG